MLVQGVVLWDRHPIHYGTDKMKFLLSGLDKLVKHYERP